MLKTGLGLGLASSDIYAAGIGFNLNLMISGDSIADAHATSGSQYRQDYIDALASYGIQANIIDGAQGGQALDSFWDISTNTQGASYDAKWIDLGLDVIAGVKAKVLGIGTNDVNALANSNYTEAQFETAYRSLINRLFTDSRWASLDTIFIRLLGRHSTQNSLGFQLAMESIRRIITKIAADTANVILLPPYYDLDLADSVHPTAGAYKIMALREAARIAYHYQKQNVFPALGISVLSGLVTETGIELNLDLDQGTDFSVPTAGEGLAACRIFDPAGNEYPFDEFQRIDASTLKLKTGAPFSFDPIVKTIYGSMFDLGASSVPMVKENGSLALPMIPETVNVSNSLDDNDKILKLNPSYYFRAGYEKNTTSGNDFDEIASVNGGSFQVTNQDFTYDASAFSNAGGVKSTNATSYLKGIGDRIDFTAGGLIGLVVDIDDTANDSQIFGLGTSSAGNGNTKVYTTSNDRIYLWRDDVSAARYLWGAGAGETVFGNQLAILISLESDSVGKFYVNDPSNPITFDPRIDWTRDTTSIWFNGIEGGNINNVFHLGFTSNGAHDPINDPSIAEIMNFMKASANIT